MTSFTKAELRFLHHRSAIFGTAIFLFDFSGFACSCLGTVLVQSPCLQMGLSLLAALFISGLHVVGHDACHQSLTPKRWLNRLLGTVAFLPSLHPFSLWELAHNRTHHRFTNILGKDGVWEPITPHEYSRLSTLEQMRYRFFRSFAGHFWYSLFEIWLKKLFFPRPSEVGGYRKEYVTDLAIVTIWCAVWPLVLLAIRSSVSDAGAWDDFRVAVVLGFAVPFLVFQVLNSIVIYLHHTHPRVQWYTTAQLPNPEEVGTLASVHIVFPAFINWLFHRIMEHTAHHLRPGIPLYHLLQGQNLIEGRTPEIVIERWSPALHFRILRCCKLFDTERRCWTGYDGQPSMDVRISGLFPLPLTPIEEYILSEDLPGSRQTFVLELSLDGEVQRASFDSGLETALRRHPLFIALIERRTWRRPRWVCAGSMRPRVHWTGIDRPLEFSDDEGIDITRETGMRLHVQVGDGRSRITVLVHHACSDAYGALEFLLDLVTGYVRHRAPESPELPAFRPLVPERLLRRGNARISIPGGKERWRFLWTAAALTFRLVFQRPASLGVPRRMAGDGVRPLKFPASLTRTLDKRIYRDLRRLARRQRTTVNDLLMRELLIVARDWNRKHAPGSRPARLAIVLPTNLRNLDHDGIPAANVVGCVFCNRRAADCDDPDRLLRSISEENQFVKSSRFGAQFLSWINGMRRVPGLLHWLHAWGGTFATIVLSNVGEPWRAIRASFPTTPEGDPIFGDLVLRDVNAASPPPPRTPAAFTVWQVEDGLRVGIRCNHRVYSLDDAEALMEMFVGRIATLVEPAADERQVRTAA